jgi:hypothetical protein
VQTITVASYAEAGQALGRLTGGAHAYGVGDRYEGYTVLGEPFRYLVYHRADEGSAPGRLVAEVLVNYALGEVA